MQTGAFKEPFRLKRVGSDHQDGLRNGAEELPGVSLQVGKVGLEGVGPVRCWQIPANSKSSPSLPKRLLNLSCDQLLAQKRGGSGLYRPVPDPLRPYGGLL